MTRREFLITAGAVAAAPRFVMEPLNFDREAARLTAATMKTFWHADAGMFRAPVFSTEAVASDGKTKNGYTLWPSLLGLHALVEGEKRHKGTYRKEILSVFDGLQQYRDPEKKAYCAWVYFPGNDGIFFDDNAWVMTIFVEAFETTGDKRCLDRAAEVMAWQRTGWVNDEAGGMHWCTDKSDQAMDRTVSATAGSALAALKLAQHGIDRDDNIRWARKLLAWIETKMLDSDGLVRDGLYAKDLSMMPTKWTYNTGVPIRALVELNALTGDKEALVLARKLGDAAIDRTKALYDSTVKDPAKRFWYDGSYFVHYLVDGLMALSKATGDRRYADECRRNARYAYDHLRDPADGLYFRNWRLWTIDEAHLKAWQRLTGQSDGKLSADTSERSQEPSVADQPVEKRPLVKTLLANGGNARMFWLVS